MSGTVDATDYEHFEYRLYDQEPLQLEEAIKKATEMRRMDITHFYHIVPADREATKFFVDSTPVGKAQSERWSKWMATAFRNILAEVMRRHG